MQAKKSVAGFIASLLYLATVVASLDENLQDQEVLTPPLAGFPSLLVHFILRGEAMQIHGQSAFEVFASPVIFKGTASVRYDGFATFVEGETEFTYIFADGAAYVVKSSGSDNYATRTVKCLSSITPFDEIVPALNNLAAIPYSSAPDKPLDCANKTAFKTSFGGVEFALCQVSKADYGFMAYGGDISMMVEYLDSPIKVSAPKLSDGTTPCATVAKAVPVNSFASALLSGKEI